MKEALGKMFKFPLSFIPKLICMPILQGRARGMKWLVNSFNHGCWLGTYERKTRVAFEKAVKKEDVVYDIGANVGFYTLLASVLVGPNGKVYAFEPLPENIKYLRKHLEINNITNVKIIEAAVSDHNGIGSFICPSDRRMACLSSEGELKVKIFSLDEAILKDNFPIPQYLKIDVEGGEMSVLAGAKMLLLEHHPIIFLATHGYQRRDDCSNFLISLGYQLKLIFANNKSGDYELLAIG